ncbi:hypothetical protein MKX01_020040 [Papaver californicum]|nr:hypothetical protein MKX01_020040 [Papaver californicum]
MQRTTSLLSSCSSSSSSSSSSSFSLPLPIRNGLHLKPNRHNSSSLPYYHHHYTTRTSLNSSLFFRRTLPPFLRSIADELKFIEIGYVCNVHGLQGELRVKPNTDFAELRFSEGKGWFKERISGKEVIKEVEIVDGREHAGQKSWILSFQGIDSIDQKQLVGLVILVREEDRQVLEQGEFYNPDLIGMRVLLKDTGELVGTVVNVFSSGGNDLLQVMLSSTEETHNGSGSVEAGSDVSAIVPDVDTDRKEMQITPPKGLLQLNLRSDVRSKKERRQLGLELEENHNIRVGRKLELPLGVLTYIEKNKGLLLCTFLPKGDVNALVTSPSHNKVFSAGSDGQSQNIFRELKRANESV